MINTIKSCVKDYLDGSMNIVQFVEKMNKIYDSITKSNDSNFDLDLITIINDIHLFAYWEWSNSELYEKVEYFQNIISGEANYKYSAFVKLVQNGNNSMSSSVLNSASQKSFKEVFHTRIDSPHTIKDIIHNTIYDLVLNTDFSFVEESDFNLINCGEDINLLHIKNTLHRLIAYYEGLQTFYLHISYDVNLGFTYIIT